MSKNWVRKVAKTFEKECVEKVRGSQGQHAPPLAVRETPIGGNTSHLREESHGVEDEPALDGTMGELQPRLGRSRGEPQERSSPGGSPVADADTTIATSMNFENSNIGTFVNNMTISPSLAELPKAIKRKSEEIEKLDLEQKRMEGDLRRLHEEVAKCNNEKRELERKLEKEKKRREEGVRRRKEEKKRRRNDIETLKTQLLDDCRESWAWEDEMDRLEEVAAGCDPHRLLAALPDVSEYERSLVFAVEGPERARRLLTLLRWRHDLRDSVRNILHGPASYAPTSRSAAAAAGRRDACGLRTVWNVPRLRLALRQATGFDKLPPDSLEALRRAGCFFSQARGQRLSTTLFEAGEKDLRILRCLLLLRHRGVHASLLLCFLEADPAATFEFVRNVPLLLRPYVHRKAHEQHIEKWLASAAGMTPAPLLVVHGIGSAGKSSLATHAAHAALSLGFHNVFWVRAGAQRLDRNEEEVYELLRRRETVLIVVDDVCDEATLFALPRQAAVIVTTRNTSIGEQFEKRDELLIEELSEDESRQLLVSIVGEEVAAKLVKRGLWNAVVKLCKDECRMPLTINILATFIKQDEQEWSDQGSKYINDLQATLEAAKKELDKKLPRTGTSYEHYTVYAAILVSLYRLDGEDRNRYLQLSIFDRHWRIAPVTMATLWSMTEPEAKAKLLSYCNCSMLTYVDGDPSLEQHDFVLHDLFHDMLLAKTSEQERQGWRQRACELYATRFESRCSSANVIDKNDVFFYTKFVQLCLNTGHIYLCASCVFQLRYIETKKTLNRVADVQDEIKTMRKRCPCPELLDYYEQLLVKQVLDDPDNILHIVRTRPDLRDINREATMIDAVDSYLCRVFCKLDSTVIAPDYCIDISELISGTFVVASVDFFSNDSSGFRLLVGGDVKSVKWTTHSVRLIDGHSNNIMFATLTSHVVLVRLSSEDFCIVVTENAVFVLRVNYDEWVLEEKETQSLPGLCIDAAMFEERLWVLIWTSDGVRLLCFTSSGQTLRQDHEFGCAGDPEHVVVSACGGAAAVLSEQNSRREVKVLRADGSLPTRVHVNGNVVGLLRGGALVCVQDQERTESVIRVIKARDSDEGGEVVRVGGFSNDAPLVLCGLGSVLALDPTSGRGLRCCIGSRKSTNVQLLRWLASGSHVFRCRDHLIVWDEGESSFVGYSLDFN